MITTFEEILEQDGQLMYRNVGDSMMPLLRQNKDLMIITRKTGKRLSVMDVPLFKRKDGKYILHRVIWVRKNDYIICGDNQWYPERGVTDSQILGVLTAVVRNGKRIEASSLGMRCYSLAQWLLYPARAAALCMARNIWPRLKRIFARSNGKK